MYFCTLRARLFSIFFSTGGMDGTHDAHASQQAGIRTRRSGFTNCNVRVHAAFKK